VEAGEFLKTAGKQPPASIYLFTSHKAPKAREATFESLLAHRAVDKMVQLYVEPGMRDLCYHVFHGEDANPSEIVSIAETLPFLTERRVLLVHGADKFETEGAGAVLHGYLENPCETTLLLLIAPRIDRRLKLFKLCEKHGVVVECPELNERDAVAWARAETAARGKKISADAARLLVHRSGTHLSDIDNAITVVCNYAGDQDMVHEIDIIAACADIAEDEIWTLTDAIANSEMSKALTTLRAMLDMGKSEFEILGSITWMLKSAYFVATNNAGRMAPFIANKHRPLAENLGREKFRDAFALCLKTDVMFRTTGVDRALVLEMLVLKLAAPRKPARAS